MPGEAPSLAERWFALGRALRGNIVAGLALPLPLHEYIQVNPFALFPSNHGGGELALVAVAAEILKLHMPLQSPVIGFFERLLNLHRIGRLGGTNGVGQHL